MSGGKLIFSFNDGVNLATREEDLAKGAIIKFGARFEHFEVQYDVSALSLTSQEEVENRVPTIEFTVKPKVKQIIGAPKHISEADESLNLPTAFHVGATEKRRGRLTKTQRRNRNRRFRRQQDRLKREVEVQNLDIIPKVAEYTPVDIIPVVEEYIPHYIQKAPPRQIIAENELEEFQNVRRQDFEHFQRIKGKLVNILEGLELHTGIFSEKEQRDILHAIYDLKDKGRAGFLRPRTYSEPRKWMKGKGRITIQFGCCYNYATDTNGNPPGIIQHEDVDPIPPLLQRMIKRMVAWHVIPPESTPDSCIVNIYEEGDCIPPHIDSHDFLRPFCTASFLGECDIVLGTELKIEGPGEFSGPVRIPLPTGSVLVFGGHGADLAKHCVPAVPRPRVSITFRKMDPRRLPYNFIPEPELQGLRPLIF